MRKKKIAIRFYQFLYSSFFFLVSFSIDNIANPLNISYDIVILDKTLINFNIEKKNLHNCKASFKTLVSKVNLTHQYFHLILF